MFEEIIRIIEEKGRPIALWLWVVCFAQLVGAIVGNVIIDVPVEFNFYVFFIGIFLFYFGKSNNGKPQHKSNEQIQKEVSNKCEHNTREEIAKESVKKLAEKYADAFKAPESDKSEHNRVDLAQEEIAKKLAEKYAGAFKSPESK